MKHFILLIMSLALAITTQAQEFVTPFEPANLVPNGITPQVLEIYQRGQRLGNHANVFVKVGDSITATQASLNNFDNHGYDLGQYVYLQKTIDAFSGSWSRDSLAAQSGFNAAAVLDPLWAPTEICQANESPLACEYRLRQPAFVVILLGSVDVRLYDQTLFHDFYEAIIQESIADGIVPIVTTFPNSLSFFDAESEADNAIIRELANEYQIPLIELRNPALQLPNRGVLDDGFHLSIDNVDGTFNFNRNEQTQYGLAMRAFLTLKMLDTLQRGLVG